MSERPEVGYQPPAMARLEAQQERRLAQYRHQLLDKALPLFLARNRQYGDSIRETGVLGACVEIVAKTARLRELVLRSSDAGERMRGTVEDTLVDLVNYGVIGLMMLDEHNWRGIVPEAGELNGNYGDHRPDRGGTAAGASDGAQPAECATQ